MKKLYLVLIPIIIIVITYCWYFSDTKVLTRKTETMLECFDKDKSSGMLGSVIQISNFRDLIAEEVSIQFPSFQDQQIIHAATPMKRSKLVTNFKGVLASCSQLLLSQKSVSVVSINHPKATTKATFHALIQHSQHKLEEELNVVFTFKDTDQGWLIQEVVITRKNGK